MGDTLIAMSLFDSLNQPVNLITQVNSLYTKWKHIFSIGDQINITEDDYHAHYQDPPHPRFLESFKVFSRYLQVDHVHLLGQNFTVGRRGKKGVAILINNGDHVKNTEFFDAIETVDPPEYPFVKFHRRSLYSTIIDLVQSAGYDPFIIDNKDISLENKIYVLNELCDFVIGYEGGMTHLAHVLRMPAIVLPWRVLPTEIPPTDFLHLDKRTYLVRDTNEIQSWTPQHLTSLVDGLYNETGYNNIWMTASSFPDPTAFLAHYAKNSSEQYYAQLDWIQPYIDKKTLGGY
jgi:hypothetical protein